MEEQGEEVGDADYESIACGVVVIMIPRFSWSKSRATLEFTILLVAITYVNSSFHHIPTLSPPSPTDLTFPPQVPPKKYPSNVYIAEAKIEPAPPDEC